MVVPLVSALLAGAVSVTACATDQPAQPPTSPAAGTGGDRAIRHGTIALVIGGRITAPRFVTGTGTEVGELRRDASGAIEAGPL